MSIPTYMRDLDGVAFICGCGHSGTTLVATILSTHPDLHVPLYESGAFLENSLTLSRLESVHAETVTAGKRVLVEKTPRHVRYMDTIRQMVPGARFIVMVRDGRDVTASIAHRYDGNFGQGVKRWVRDNRIVLRERNAPDVLLVRYEDFVTNPPGELQRICGFLGVAYSNALLEYHTSPKLWFGRTDLKQAGGVGPEHEDLRNWQVNQPIFDGRGRWTRDLPPAVVKKLGRGRALRLMRAFGYLPRPWWRRWWPA